MTFSIKVSTRTFFKNGSISSALQPGVFHESKSERWARVYTIQFMAYQPYQHVPQLNRIDRLTEPPPRVPPDGTMGERSASWGDFLVCQNSVILLVGKRFRGYNAG